MNLILALDRFLVSCAHARRIALWAPQPPLSNMPHRHFSLSCSSHSISPHRPQHDKYLRSLCRILSISTINRFSSILVQLLKHNPSVPPSPSPTRWAHDRLGIPHSRTSSRRYPPHMENRRLIQHTTRPRNRIRSTHVRWKWPISRFISILHPCANDASRSVSCERQGR